MIVSSPIWAVQAKQLPNDFCQEPDSEVSQAKQYLAVLRVSMRIEAIIAQAVEDAIDLSQFLASLRQRPSHAKVRSTTYCYLLSGEHFEALGLVRVFDDVDCPPAHANEGGLQLVLSITTISIQVTQPREPRANCSQHIYGLIAILVIGGANEDEDQKAESVCQNVPFATLYLPFCQRQSQNPAIFCVLRRLAVDYSSSGRGLRDLRFLAGS